MSELDKALLLIAKQALLIESQNAQIAEFRKSVVQVRGLIYSIGGPLNDNRLGYTPAQMGDFRNILLSLDCELEEGAQ